MAREGFRRNSVVHPNGSARTLSSVMWVKCTNLYRVCVFNLSIAASLVMGISSYQVTPFDQHSRDGMTFIGLIC